MQAPEVGSGWLVITGGLVGGACVCNRLLSARQPATLTVTARHKATFLSVQPAKKSALLFADPPENLNLPHVSNLTVLGWLERLTVHFPTYASWLVQVHGARDVTERAPVKKIWRIVQERPAGQSKILKERFQSNVALIQHYRSCSVCSSISIDKYVWYTREVLWFHFLHCGPLKNSHNLKLLME